MKIKTLIPLLGLTLALSLGAGCASIQVPASKHYEVKIGDTTVRANVIPPEFRTTI